VKRLVEVSPRHRHPKLCRVQKIKQQTRHGMHFAVVVDKLDLYATQRTIQYNTTLFYYTSHTQQKLVSTRGVGGG